MPGDASADIMAELESEPGPEHARAAPPFSREHARLSTLLQKASMRVDSQSADTRGTVGACIQILALLYEHAGWGAAQTCPGGGRDSTSTLLHAVGCMLIGLRSKLYELSVAECVAFADALEHSDNTLEGGGGGCTTGPVAWPGAQAYQRVYCWAHSEDTEVPGVWGHVRAEEVVVVGGTCSDAHRDAGVAVCVSACDAPALGRTPNEGNVVFFTGGDGRCAGC